MKSGVAGLSAALLVGLLLILFAGRRIAIDAPPRSSALNASETPVPVAPVMTPRLQRVIAAPIEKKPTENAGSLRGSDVDGGVHPDASGRVIVDRDLRRLFDYFLERVGEQPLSTLREQLLAWLRGDAKLNDIARSEVMLWFDRYVGLQHAMAGIGSSDARADLQRLDALRRAHLGDAVADAWFAAEQRDAQIALERLAIAHDAMLDPTQRSDKLAALDRQRDAGERAEREQGVDFEIATQLSQHYALAGTEAATRYAERSAMWGDDAAQRMAALDQQQAGWDARLTAYAQERDRIIANDRLSTAQRDAQLSLLLQDFSEPEQRRLLALIEAKLLPH